MNKIVVLLIVGLMGVVSCHYHHLGQHHHHHQQKESHVSDHHKDYYAHPKYVFEYGVNDPHTHDMKKQWESRDGDVVKGSYKFVQPDGRIRIVHYYADDKNGFNAEVKYQGKAQHPAGHQGQSKIGPKAQGPIYSSKRPSFSGSHGSHWSSHHRPCPVHHSAGEQAGRTSIHGHSALRMGYSVGLAGGLDPHVVGFDAQEPHGYKVQEASAY